MFPTDSKILVVDDSAPARTLIKGLLVRTGYKNVQEAEDGKVALGMVRQNHATGVPFRLIVLDWNMPVMPGIHFLVELKADIKFREVPVLIVTSEKDVKQVVQAISAGAADYVVKPFDDALLLDKMKAIWKRVSLKK